MNPDDPYPIVWRDVPQVVNDLAHESIGLAIQVHRDLGSGLLEKPYKLVLAARLAQAGHRVAVEKPIPLSVDGIDFDVVYRADIVVDDVLLIETKSVQEISWGDVRQVKTYLRLGGFPLGLIFNFRLPLLHRGGITRVVA